MSNPGKTEDWNMQERIRMENRTTENGFKYTYSAKEQEEIKRIRQKYTAKEEDAMTRVRKLDAQASGKATAVALAMGILGALVLGTGMSLIMTDLAAVFGMSYIISIFVGVLAGLVGMVMVILAYPVYLKVLKTEQDKIAPEIIRLTDELMK